MSVRSRLGHCLIHVFSVVNYTCTCTDSSYMHGVSHYKIDFALPQSLLCMYILRHNQVPVSF